MSTERCYCLPGRCDAIVLFIAHYSISHPCYTIMFNSFEQIKWGGGSEGRGGGVLEFLLSVPTALLFDSCPILYSASSPHAHPRWKKNRAQLAQFTLYTPSRMWAHEQREHISTPTLLRTWPENYCVFFFTFFFLCVVFAFHLAGIQLTSIQGDFLIQCECICLHSSCAVPRFFASAHTNTNPHRRHFSASKKYLSTFFLLPV